MSAVFGHPIYSDASALQTPTYGSGSWVASLPLANIAKRELTKVARSTDASATSTKLRVDLQIARPVGLLAVLIPNLTKSSTPTVQWKGGTTAGASDVYAPAAVQVWPSGLTLEDVVRPDGSQEHIWSVVIPSAAQSARHWELDIVDTANADGYLDVARVIIAGAYRPSVCMRTGAASGLEDDTVRSKTDGGATLYQAKAISRTDVFTLPNVPRSEALLSIRRMQQRLGTSGQLFFVWDETDPYLYERSYAGTMRQLGALDYNFSALYNSVAFEIAEDL